MGGVERGSREGDARRSKHRRERVKRATEERSKGPASNASGTTEDESAEHREATVFRDARAVAAGASGAVITPSLSSSVYILPPHTLRTPL